MFSAVTLDIPDSDWDSIAVRFATIWPKICKAANAYLTEYATKANRSERLRVYIRPDSGMLFFALTGSRQFYGEVASVNISYVERCYYGIRDNEAFEESHNALMLRVARMLSSSITNYTARNAITALCTDRQITITLSEYDDDETERELFAAS